MGNYNFVQKINEEELPSDKIYHKKKLSVKISTLYHSERPCIVYSQEVDFSPTIDMLEKKYPLTCNLFLEMTKKKLACYCPFVEETGCYDQEFTERSKMYCVYFYKQGDKDIFAELFKKEFFEEQEKAKINYKKYTEQMYKELQEKDKFSKDYQEIQKKLIDTLENKENQ